MSERWCNTCGKRLETTSATATECPTCVQWWRDNPPTDHPRTDPDELVERVARAIDPEAWADELPIPTRAHTIAFHAGRAKSIVQARAALSAIDQEALLKAERERCAKVAKHQAIISGCKKRRTKRLGLIRDAYFTEIADEVAQAIRSLPPVTDELSQ